jgi:hypothetical protein
MGMKMKVLQPKKTEAMGYHQEIMKAIIHCAEQNRHISINQLAEGVGSSFAAALGLSLTATLRDTSATEASIVKGFKDGFHQYRGS